MSGNNESATCSQKLLTILAWIGCTCVMCGLILIVQYLSVNGPEWMKINDKEGFLIGFFLLVAELGTFVTTLAAMIAINN